MLKIGRFLATRAEDEAAGGDLRPCEPLPRPIPIPGNDPMRPTDGLDTFIRGARLGPVLARKGVERQDVVFGLVEQPGDLRGPSAGHEFTAVHADNVPFIDADRSMVGDTQPVGLACEAGTFPAADPTHKIALIERGVCDFQVRTDLVEAAGYEGAIVFNRTGEDGCETLVTMLATSDIPAIFVSHTDGFRILGGSLDGYTCSMGADAAGTAAPGVGHDSSEVDVRAVFDGWGYVHLFDAKTMAGLDQYFIPESQDEDYADGFGDLSVHEVATDPDEDLAYISYYAGGLRVLKYDDDDLTEVGAYIDPDGNNFWGVEVHKHPNGQKYVLASDRDSGVWIFQYTGD